MKVLGIETSCDETAAAVVGPHPEDPRLSQVLCDHIYTQTVHAEFSGVVPELASRAHAEKITPVVKAALREAGLRRPDAVAVTSGPGLIGAVLVGLAMAKSLALGWGVPLVGVNHLEGHLLSPLLEDPAPQFPFLALVVSGGHSTLYEARSLGDYRILSTTVDDAAGEAFDKVARLLGLGYPGGPVIDRLAQQGEAVIPLPRPRPRQRPQDFSFSGLKTAVARVTAAQEARPEDIAASFQTAVVDVLRDRVEAAMEATGLTQLALAGGVAANSQLRDSFRAIWGDQLFLPPRSRCTDNASMIAHAGRLRLLRGQRDGLDIGARARWQAGQP